MAKATSAENRIGILGGLHHGGDRQSALQALADVQRDRTDAWIRTHIAKKAEGRPFDSGSSIP
ncbi:MULTISPECIES: hypothetical protein [Methylobacterium]|uniref:hypothetical protein n=1 Tax=Methylobacterium TaxID=407 RepID=UPI0011CB61EB|nr:MULTISPECIES: hypothetical protein [Methylobacterium]TXN24492.1 hypothetical protein FV217_03205 [Methylobacterium sp. WL9]